jgi:hypothetical protein
MTTPPKGRTVDKRFEFVDVMMHPRQMLPLSIKRNVVGMRGAQPRLTFVIVACFAAWRLR